MRRRSSASIAANPVLIGAATTLVVLVAVFLAYNANSGLPFVPSYQLSAEVPNAANLVVGNDVRIGGTRVGTVDAITPVVRRDGSVVARLGIGGQERLTGSTAAQIAVEAACALVTSLGGRRPRSPRALPLIPTLARMSAVPRRGQLPLMVPWPPGSPSHMSCSEEVCVIAGAVRCDLLRRRTSSQLPVPASHRRATPVDAATRTSRAGSTGQWWIR